MFYYNYNLDNDICTSKGICSAAPDITALQESMFVMLRGLVHYLLELESLGARNDNIKIDIIYSIVYLATLQEFTREQIFLIITNLYSNFVNTQNVYHNLCEDNELQFKKFNSPIKFESTMDLNTFITKGERVYKFKYKSLEKYVRNYAEILFSIIKSIAFLLVELKDNDKIDYAKVDKIINAINLYNKTSITKEKLRKLISALADLNADLMFELNEIKTEKFGKIKLTTVSQASEKGKSILVSGNNLSELQEVLENVKDTDINVYTNGNLLIAHAYSKFNQYKNLRGHFGNGVETSVLDFATFPGAILLTKNEAHNVEYLYRGRIFTTDDIPPKGISRLDSKNLQPLIQSALETRGFKKAHKKASVDVGFNIDDIDNLFSLVANNLEQGVYKYLFVVGLSNPNDELDNYFKNLFHAKPKDAFVISFSYESKCNNVFSVNVANDYSLTTKLLFRLFEKVKVDSDKLNFFVTRCDNSAIAGIIRLCNRGAKNIYMSNCQPNIINPSTLREFKKFYKIHDMTTATSDLEKITKNNSD